jgi:serine/threonine protein phosphatase PrpC
MQLNMQQQLQQQMQSLNGGSTILSSSASSMSSQTQGLGSNPSSSSSLQRNIPPSPQSPNNRASGRGSSFGASPLQTSASSMSNGTSSSSGGHDSPVAVTGNFTIGNQRVGMGHSSVQGLRPSMEDEVIMTHNIVVPSSMPNSFQHAPLILLAVIDGHGGRACAEFVRDNLVDNFRVELSRCKSIPEAIRQAFLNTDNEFLNLIQGDHSRQNSNSSRSGGPYGPTLSLNGMQGDMSGSTLCAVVIDLGSKTLWCANVGDSRCVLARARNNNVALSSDHKASRPDEVQRVEQAGGFVVYSRLLGELAVSRAMGDISYKRHGKELVIADPEITTTSLKDDDEFVVVACDGIWDVMSNDEAMEFVRGMLKKPNMTAQKVAEALTTKALQMRSSDNVSCLVLVLPSANNSSGTSSQQQTSNPSLSNSFTLGFTSQAAKNTKSQMMAASYNSPFSPNLSLIPGYPSSGTGSSSSSSNGLMLTPSIDAIGGFTRGSDSRLGPSGGLLPGQISNLSTHNPLTGYNIHTLNSMLNANSKADVASGGGGAGTSIGANSGSSGAYGRESGSFLKKDDAIDRHSMNGYQIIASNPYASGNRTNASTSLW